MLPLTNEFTIHIELRDGRPLAVRFDSLAKSGIGQNINGLVFANKHIEDVDSRCGEPALGLSMGPLHKKYNRMSVQ